MFRSPIPHLRAPDGWTLFAASGNTLAQGRYEDALTGPGHLDDSESWFRVAVGERVIALIAGLTRTGVKSVSKRPDRLSTFNQQVRIRAWHVEDTVSAGVGEWVPVASVGVLPYGWIVKGADPAVAFTTHRGLRSTLRELDADQRAWRPFLDVDWLNVAQTAVAPGPRQHELVIHSLNQPDRRTPPGRGNT